MSQMFRQTAEFALVAILNKLDLLLSSPVDWSISWDSPWPASPSSWPPLFPTWTSSSPCWGPWSWPRWSSYSPSWWTQRSPGQTSPGPPGWRWSRARWDSSELTFYCRTVWYSSSGSSVLSPALSRPSVISSTSSPDPLSNLNNNNNNNIM